MNDRNGYNNDGDGSGNCGLFSLSACKFSLLASLLGILLIDNLNLDQQNSLGNFLENVGQNLLTAAAQGEIVQERQQAEIRRQIQSLKKQIAALEDQLDNRR
jgi:hypothetical protein